MGEIEEWFERELGPYGFSLTPMTYDPNHFTPMKGVMYEYVFDDEGHRRCVKLRTQITPDLANDLQVYGRTFQDDVNDYRAMIMENITREVYAMGLPNPFSYEPKPINFTPKEEITTFKFI